VAGQPSEGSARRACADSWCRASGRNCALRTTGSTVDVAQPPAQGRVDSWLEQFYGETHLSECVHEHCLAALQRSLRPSALLIVTIRPPEYLAQSDAMRSVADQDRAMTPEDLHQVILTLRRKNSAR
jgi:hypothetical protein